MSTDLKRIRVRRGTAAQWAAANPVLLDGERGLDTTNRIEKVGDGATAWADLPIAAMPRIAGAANYSGTPPTGVQVYDTETADPGVTAPINGAKWYDGSVWRGGIELPFDGPSECRLTRSYPFSVIPATTSPGRNTFTAGFEFSLGPPAVWFISKAATIETKKMLEAVVEARNATTIDPFGQGWLYYLMGQYSAETDFAQVIQCQMSGYALTMADAAADGFVGIEFGSAGVATYNNLTASGPYFQLRKMLNDADAWQLVAHADGAAGLTTVAFSVPVITVEGHEQPDDVIKTYGHNVALVWDPWAVANGARVSAWVDGVERAHIDVATAPSSALLVGLIVYSGNQLAANQIIGQWTGMSVTNYATGLVGKGAV